jgi:hypothetical protein
MSALLEYECRVPVDGYEVISVEEPRSTRRIESIPMLYESAYEITPSKAKREKLRMLHPRSGRIKCFDLFESPSAYLEFAQKPPTEDGIKDLANRYGPLFPDLPDPPRPPDGTEKAPLSIQFSGRRIDEWSSYIVRMRRHVELWKMSIKTGDFSRIIRAVEGNINPAPGLPLELFLKEDQVRWIRGRGPLSASARLCIRPPTLVNALWAQLILAIDGKQNLRTCVQCRKWFTVEAGQGRSDKKYCSDACRMRAYRKRRGS